jgi:hypothetical protein
MPRPHGGRFHTQFHTWSAGLVRGGSADDVPRLIHVWQESACRNAPLLQLRLSGVIRASLTATEFARPLNKACSSLLPHFIARLAPGGGTARRWRSVPPRPRRQASRRTVFWSRFLFTPTMEALRLAIKRRFCSGVPLVTLGDAKFFRYGLEPRLGFLPLFSPCGGVALRARPARSK